MFLTVYIKLGNKNSYYIFCIKETSTETRFFILCSHIRTSNDFLYELIILGRASTLYSAVSVSEMKWNTKWQGNKEKQRERIHCNKTEYIVVSKTDWPWCDLQTGDINIKWRQKWNYLGCVATNDWKYYIRIRRRMGRAKNI